MAEDLKELSEYSFEIDDTANVFSWNCGNVSGFISLANVVGARLIDSPGTLFDPKNSVTLKFISHSVNAFDVNNIIHLSYTKLDKRNLNWLRQVFAALQMHFKRKIKSVKMEHKKNG